MLIEPEITGASIVLVGNFNPAILSPDWFARHDLIKDAAINRTDPEFIVHPQITQFKFDWCQIVSEPNRFTMSSTQESFIRIADLTAKTFGELLPHTPIRQLGISRQVHFRVSNINIRDALGFKLAPPESWGAWGVKVRAQNATTRGGLRSLTMEQRVFETQRTGFLATKVEPSSLLPKGIGVFVQVNDHHDFDNNGPVEGAQAAMTLLRTSFESSIRNAESIIDHIMRLANEAHI